MKLMPVTYTFVARMAVPKLVSEVSDASGFCSVASVDGCFCCEKHDYDAELSVERYFG